MKKRLSILILAAIMIFSLAACGNSNNETQPPEGENPGIENGEVGGEVGGDVIEDPSVGGDVGGDVEDPSVGGNDTPDPQPSQPAGDTIAQTLLKDFQAMDPSKSAQEIADALLTNEVILFSGMTMPMEPGMLMGFGNIEITGFEECVTFAPMIGTIPFMGYIFDMADGADMDAFVQMLKDNANPAWNICTEADETVVAQSGDKVFFLMAPMYIEE